MEIFDLIDNNGNLTGEKADRKLVHNRGLKHHAVGLLITRGGVEKQILLQKRSLKKEKNAGLWDLTAGHVASGETLIESLIREIKEEIGINIKEDEIKLLSKYWRKEKYREDFIENELDYIYILDKNIDIKDIKVQEEEVDDVKWIDLTDFKEMLKRGEIVKRQVWQDFLNLIDDN